MTSMTTQGPTAPGTMKATGKQSIPEVRRRAGGVLRTAAGGSRRRPAQRRQVDAGEPDPRPPRSGRAGHARGDPRPGVLRRAVDRSPLHGAGHRRLGARRQGSAAVGGRTGGGRDADRRRDHPGRRRRRRCDLRRRGRRADSAALRQAGVPGGQQGRQREAAKSDAAALWSLGLGEPHAISAMHGRGVADLLDEVVAVLPAVSESGRRRQWRTAPGGAGRQAERRQEFAAQPAGR